MLLSHTPPRTIIIIIKLLQIPRPLILKTAAKYIENIRKSNSSSQNDIEAMKKSNELLENQSKYLNLVFRSDNWSTVICIITRDMNCIKCPIARMGK